MKNNKDEEKKDTGKKDTGRKDDGNEEKTAVESGADVRGKSGEHWLYTEVVKDHFFHPRNISRTPEESSKFAAEADGIGQVGSPSCGDVMKMFLKIKNDKIVDCRWETFGCCEEGELVSTPKGFVPVENIKVDDIVLNHKGEEVFVEETSKRKIDGLIHSIIPMVSKFNTIHLTEEHPVLAIKRKHLNRSRPQKHTSYFRVDKEVLIGTTPNFFLVKELEKGDFLVYSISRKTKDLDNIDTDAMKLLGFYLSEGYFSAKEKISGIFGLVAFAFHKNETEYINELKILLERKFGKKPSERIRGNVSEVYLCSRKAVRFFETYCGHLAKNKKIHKDIMYLPIAKQKVFLDYYFKGDGCLFIDKRKNRKNQYIMTTASEQLVLQLQQLIARQGYFATISKRKTVPSVIAGRLIKSKPSFVISYIKDRKNKSFTHQVSDYFLVPIQAIDQRKYSGLVYNFQVSGENKSYLVRGFAVHNCASAIASTSMLSVMVIGKTLDEAKKIRPMDIVKALGGLPDRKIHCSVLGDQALRAAIKNYEDRKKGLAAAGSCEKGSEDECLHH